MQAGGQVVFDGGDEGGQSGLRRLFGRCFRVVGVPAQRLADGQSDGRIAIRVGTELAEALNDRQELERPSARARCRLTCRLNMADRTADGLSERL